MWNFVKEYWIGLVGACALIAIPFVFLRTPDTQFDKATNTLTINYDGGGIIHNYVKRMNRLYRFGVNVRLNGPIYSAGTLFSVYPKVCTTKNAFLAFHAVAYNAGTKDRPIRGETDSRSTQLIMNVYPSDINEWINDHGGLQRDFIYMKPPELFYHIPQCQ